MTYINPSLPFFDKKAFTSVGGAIRALVVVLPLVSEVLVALLYVLYFCISKVGGKGTADVGRVHFSRRLFNDFDSFHGVWTSFTWSS